MSEYKRFIKVWECIHKMNTQGIFDYGYATDRGNGILIEFDNESEKQNYKNIFGE